MYYQFPLRTVATSRQARSQLEFARAASQVLEQSDDLAVAPLREGLVLFAAHESALDGPALTLSEVYADVDVPTPSVRMIAGDPIQEPVMQVRVRSRRSQMGDVLRALRLRGVKVIEECLRGREFLVRGEAPMRSLLGLPRELERLTDGTSAHWVQLARYEPVR